MRARETRRQNASTGPVPNGLSWNYPPCIPVVWHKHAQAHVVASKVEANDLEGCLDERSPRPVHSTTSCLNPSAPTAGKCTKTGMKLSQEDHRQYPLR